MKKKAMIIATIYSFVSHFEKNDIKILQELGYEVIVASNFEGYKGELEELNVEKLDIPFTRSPISFNNIRAFSRLNEYLKENKVDLIHCHTPVGGVAGRIIGRWNKVPKIVYTAHGFHFFDGAPKLNWIIYYPIEKLLSKFTDVLITINKEDYERAKTFYAKKVEYIPGVGIDVEKIQNIKVDREQKRKELGLSLENIVLLSVGELNDNKNHITPIRALAKLNNKNIKYLIAGKGPLESYLKEEIKKLGLENQVKLLGYRNDIYELNKISDIFVFPSKREGLSVALMEAMVCQLLIACSNIRGNRDLIEKYKNGILLENKIESYIEGLLLLNKNLEKKYDKKSSFGKISSIEVENMLVRIYKENIKD